jgi:hypothetical protein
MVELKCSPLHVHQTRVTVASSTPNSFAILRRARPGDTRHDSVCEPAIRDCKVEQGEIAYSMSVLAVDPDASNVFGPQRWLLADQLSFPSRLSASPHLSTRQYARMIRRWAGAAGLDPTAYGTHSMRRYQGNLDLQAHEEPQGRPVCCSAIVRLKAQSDTLASKLMTRLRFRSKPRSSATGAGHTNNSTSGVRAAAYWRSSLRAKSDLALRSRHSKWLVCTGEPPDKLQVQFGFQTFDRRVGETSTERKPAAGASGMTGC